MKEFDNKNLLALLHGCGFSCLTHKMLPEPDMDPKIDRIHSLRDEAKAHFERGGKRYEIVVWTTCGLAVIYDDCPSDCDQQEALEEMITQERFLVAALMPASMFGIMSLQPGFSELMDKV